MKRVFVPLLMFTLAGCAPIPYQVKADSPKLDELLLSYNQEGYTKKTYFFLVENELDKTDNFHARANSRSRSTYYKADEQALLMGDYEGGFSIINSGYKNVDENTVQHFRFNGDMEIDDLFTSIEEDWTAEDQTVGKYYQTLTSLSLLYKEAAWEYDGSFTYNVSNPEIEDGHFKDEVFHSFLFFAAPMLLETASYSWAGIKITDCTTYLSIKIRANKDPEKDLTGLVEDGYEIISEAKIFKGIKK